MNTKRLFSALALGLGLTLGLLWLMGSQHSVVLADPGILYVAPGGDCGGVTPCHATVQAAVDAASAGDEIRVATGTYAAVSAREGVTQTVYISKTVTVRGGYTTANWTTPDPEANPTTLDAQGLGRVLYITGDISPTVEGLRITGGNASNVAANPGCGGGIYSDGGDPIITNNVITNNIAYTSTTSWGYGGGIYLSTASASALISGNLVVSNTASTAYRGKGGGLYMLSSAATVSNNTFLNNVAGAAYSSGGGLHLYLSPAIVSGNLIQSNKSSPDGTGYGGGFHTQFGDITLSGNTVVSNTSSYGALTFESNASITMINNVIAQNVGGVFVRGNATSPFAGTLVHNTIAQNGSEGIYVGWYSSGYSSLTLTNNIIVSHTTGIYVYPDPTNSVTATHTLFYGNSTDTSGGIITSTNVITGNPLFVDPAGWDYHIQAGSAAIDRGVDAGAVMDIDSDTRPHGAGFDLGADEFMGMPAARREIYLPLAVRG